jgi:rRNA-processing protein FCF1
VTVLLDANALMMPSQFRLDLFDEIRTLVGGFEPVVLPSIIQELTGLSRAQGKDGAAARFGLSLAGQCTVADAGDVSPGTVDEQVIDYAVRHNCLVVTNDRHVRDVLLGHGIGVISMRKQKRLEIIRR